MPRLPRAVVTREPPEHLRAPPDGPAIVSVVGKSNTGKTTLLEGVVPALRNRGVSVGVLKHHGHPTPFDMPGKDTYRLSAIGAEVVVGLSPIQVAVFRNVAEPDIDEVLRSSLGGVDLVLTEGYRRGPYPKIEVLRAERSARLLCTENELLAVVTDIDLPVQVPQFQIGDAQSVAAFLEAWRAGLADST